MANEFWKPGDPCATCGNTNCKCMICSYCDKRVVASNMCPKCSRCRDHHTEWYPKDFPHRACQYTIEPTSNTFIINPLHRKLGVEIELGSFGAVRESEGNNWINWDIVHDGSVAESGSELVTDPMTGDNYIYGMSKLVSNLNTSGAHANNTCGYHVHVDSAELTPFDLRRIAVTFTLIQQKLYGTLVATTRNSDWGRQYCAPLKLDPAALMAIETKAEFVDWLHSWLYNVKMPNKTSFMEAYGNEANANALYKETLLMIDRQLKEFKNTKYVNRARRWALNFHSWMMRGTLEFRLKEGTTQMDDLLLWPLWCGWFVQRVAAASDKEAHYWLKKDIGVMEISEFMAEGPMGMPDYIMDWVRRRCQ